MMTSANTREKPLLVIKRENIFRPVTPLEAKTAAKRPSVDQSIQTGEPSVKRLCSGTPDHKKSGKVGIKDYKTVNKTNGTSIQKITVNATDQGIKDLSRPIFNRKCSKHLELPEHKADGLVKVGDLYESIEEFNEYISEHAKYWFFYYTRGDSRNCTMQNFDKNKPSHCYYQCRFNQRSIKKYKIQGLRKRKEKLSLHCPANVMLKRERGQDVFVVKSVCHHHRHELTAELFHTLPHGHRLPQEIKDEIRDLALFNVHPMLARAYIQSKTPGLKLKKTVVNQFSKVKRQNTKPTMSPERVNEMLAKIKYIKANFDMSYIGLRVMVKQRKTPRTDIQESNEVYCRNIQIEHARDATPYDQKCAESIEALRNSATKVQEKWQGEFPNETDIQCMNVRYETEDEVASDNHVAPNNSCNFNEQEQCIVVSDEQMHMIDSRTGSLIEQTPDDSNNGNILTTRILENRFSSVSPTDGVLDNHVTSETAFDQITESSNTVKLHGIADESIQGIEIVDETDEVKSNSNVTEKKNLKKKLRTMDTKKSKTLKKTKCQKRHCDLPEYQAEFLIQVGSTFSSMEEFLNYTSAYAPKWYFYYYISGSNNVKNSDKYNDCKATWYNFACRFNKGGYKSRSTGIRKIKRKTIVCPAQVNMKCEPGSSEFTVTYVCHHHNHELTAEKFSQESHGLRLSTEIKDEIRELAWYKLDVGLIHQYIKAKTGYNLKVTTKNIVAKMKKEKQKIVVSPSREKEIMQKIKYIRKHFTMPRPILLKVKKEKSESDDEENRSRLQARLNDIQYDQELIQSVRELQENTGCEIQINQHGGVDVLDNGALNLQVGLIQNTVYHDTPPENEEETDCQIKIDQELYTMDENVEYIIPNNEDQANIFGVGTPGECVEKVVYIQHVDGETVISDEGIIALNADNVNEDDIRHVQNEVQDESHNNIGYEECYENGTNEECAENDTYEQSAENITYEECDETIEYVEQVHEETTSGIVTKSTEPDTNLHEAAFEYSDNENEDEYLNIRYKYKNYDESLVNSDGCNYVRNVGIQTNLEIISLENDCEQIQLLEKLLIKQDVDESKQSASTRGRPKVILEEQIINRFNIEFFICLCGVAKCLENLAYTMNLSVLDLMKQLYQGEIVFKMTMGRCGAQGRKTVHLAYVPLTIAFPYDKFKYTNCLKEYKDMCSRYSDVTMNLENTIHKLSTDLEEKTSRLEKAESEKSELTKIKEEYQNLLKAHILTEGLLKGCQKSYAETKVQNEVLTKKLKHMEQIKISSRLKDAEILTQLLELNMKSGQANVDIKFLDEKSPPNNSLVERTLELEQALETANNDIEQGKNKIKNLEEIYLSDSQSLLLRIKTLEAELGPLKEEVEYMKKTENPQSYILKYTELENKKLRDAMKDLDERKSAEIRKLTKEVKELEKSKLSDNQHLVAKMKRLDEARLALLTHIDNRKVINK